MKEKKLFLRICFLDILFGVLLIMAIAFIGNKVTKLEDRMDAMVSEHNKTKEKLNELVGKQKKAGEYTYTALVETVQYLEGIVTIHDDNVLKYNQNWEDQWEFNNAIIDYLR